MPNQPQPFDPKQVANRLSSGTFLSDAEKQEALDAELDTRSPETPNRHHGFQTLTRLLKLADERERATTTGVNSVRRAADYAEVQFSQVQTRTAESAKSLRILTWVTILLGVLAMLYLTVRALSIENTAMAVVAGGQLALFGAVTVGLGHVAARLFQNAREADERTERTAVLNQHYATAQTYYMQTGDITLLQVVLPLIEALEQPRGTAPPLGQADLSSTISIFDRRPRQKPADPQQDDTAA